MAELKKCTNCTRGLQPLDQFINEKGRECSTCNKCRAKGKKYDTKPERREFHNELQKEKRYDIAWRAKQLEERPDEFRQHNNEVSKKWKTNNPEYVATWSRTHASARLNALKYAAERRGIEWNLTDDEAKVMLVSPCVYCKHLDLEVRVNGIDRLDSAKPYTIENCRPCCKNCNYMKGTYDPKTFIEFAKKIAACEEEFPEVPRCNEHKKLNRPKPVPDSEQGIHATSSLDQVQVDYTETNEMRQY